MNGEGGGGSEFPFHLFLYESIIVGIDTLSSRVLEARFPAAEASAVFSRARTSRRWGNLPKGQKNRARSNDKAE